MLPKVVSLTSRCLTQNAMIQGLKRQNSTRQTYTRNLPVAQEITSLKKTPKFSLKIPFPKWDLHHLALYDPYLRKPRGISDTTTT